MDLDRNRKQALLSWLAVGALLLLCGVLGALQYTWIGEVSFAERERLRSSLQASLNRLSLSFNTQLTSACASLVPRNLPLGEEANEKLLATLYREWKETSEHHGLFRRVALATPDGDSFSLRSLDLDAGVFRPSEWPPEWSGIKARLETRGPREPWQGPPRPPEGDEGLVVQVPLMGRPPRDMRPPRQERREPSRLLLEVNLDYIRESVIPELIQKHLGARGTNEYQVEVIARGTPPSVIYRSDSTQKESLGPTADASVALFALQFDQVFRHMGPGGLRGGPGPRGPAGDWGRWQLLARHRAGSLDKVVTWARWRNLSVTAAIFLLMLVTLAALLVFTRRAQRLAELQMDFVAGVSHELRTPLTVIRTAAHNLRGRLAQNPSQVERYGTLIQQESERLTRLVEQILRFASAKAGRVARVTEPVSIEAVIEESLESSQSVIEGARCVVEKKIEPGLPLIIGDPVALKHAVQNLLSNAAKYGAESNSWIGVSAARSSGSDPPAIEIRVADRGPGIPADERDSIFDPFFRGKRALQDQVHGTGLGLSLVKGIVEAHGGSISVNSGDGKGTEFVIRVPVAPPEQQDEFTNSSHRG